MYPVSSGRGISDQLFKVAFYRNSGLRTANRFMRDVQKGATLPDGVSEGCPLGSIKVPFQKWKGIRGWLAHL